MIFSLFSLNSLLKDLSPFDLRARTTPLHAGPRQGDLVGGTGISAHIRINHVCRSVHKSFAREERPASQPASSSVVVQKI